MRSAAEISTGADREQEASRIDISIRVPGATLFMDGWLWARWMSVGESDEPTNARIA